MTEMIIQSTPKMQMTPKRQMILLYFFQLQLVYDANEKPSGAKISHHLLESSRVCAANSHESNFHIFYYLVFGSTNDFLSKICLNPSMPYKVSNYEIRLYFH